MANHEIAFSTFLKILELNEVQKRSALRNYLRGGGFNYWRPLQTLAQEVIAAKISLPEISEKVGQMATGHRRKYNEAALEKLFKWVGRRKLQYRKRPEKVVKDIGEEGFSVRLDPEAAFEMDGRFYIMQIWATNSPNLSEETISMGLFFLREGMKALPHSPHFLIYDTIKDRVYSEVNILQEAPKWLSHQKATIDQLWREINSPESGHKRPIIDNDEDRPFQAH